METYRDCTITCDPPPIPDRRFDWSWSHKNYDGAEDSGDHRAGYAASLHDCKADIDEMFEQLEDV